MRTTVAHRLIRQATALLRRYPGVGCHPNCLTSQWGERSLQGMPTSQSVCAAGTTGLCAEDRAFVCSNMAFAGDYTPVLAKHSKNFSLEDSLAIGVDRMQRNFGPLKQQVEEWQALQLSAASAKLLIYRAFIEDELGFPKHLARRVHELYFQPVHEEFQAQTMWSLSNAFTSAFKELEPIPQYKATAKLAGFLQSVRPS